MKVLSNRLHFGDYYCSFILTFQRRSTDCFI